MFTDEEIQVYRSVKAPVNLREKITKPRKKPRKIFYFSSIGVACFILIIFGFVINNQSNIVVNGQILNDSIVFYDTSVSKSRAVSSKVSIPIEINALHSTEVSVSQGLISLEGSNPSKEIVISSSSTIWWEITPSETDNLFEMRISNNKGVEKVTLKYENTKITATKEKLK